MGEPATGGQEPAVVALDRDDRADGAGQPIGLDQVEGSVRFDAVAEDAAGIDVDPEQLVAPCIPARALAEEGLLVRPRPGSRRHDLNRWRWRCLDARSLFTIGEYALGTAGGTRRVAEPAMLCSRRDATADRRGSGPTGADA